MVESKLDAKSGKADITGLKDGINAGVKLEGRLEAEGAKRLAELFRGLSERMKAAGADQDAVCKTTAAIAGMAERAEKPDYFVLHILRRIVPKELNVRNMGTLQEDVRLFGLLLGKYMRDHGLEMLPEKSTRAIIEQLGNDLKPADMRGHFDHKGRVCDSGVYDSRGDTVYSDGGYWTRKPEPDY